MSKLDFVIGYLKYVFNPHVSCLALVSSNNKIDRRTTIYRGVKIKGSRVGAFTYIGAGTDVENAEIGRFCSISDHCRIGMGGHFTDQLSTSPIFTQVSNGTKCRWVSEDVNSFPMRKVYIGNDVLIGSHALILGGVTVGDGAVIGAGAVVTKNVPPYAVVGGVPAKIIRYRFPQDIIDRLKVLQWWNMDVKALKNSIALFQSKEVTIEEIDRLTQKYQ